MEKVERIFCKKVNCPGYVCECYSGRVDREMLFLNKRLHAVEQQALAFNELRNLWALEVRRIEGLVKINANKASILIEGLKAIADGAGNPKVVANRTLSIIDVENNS